MTAVDGRHDAGGRSEEPIAIIGMACRYPGDASSPSGFWDMIQNARTAHSPIPAERFNVDAWYHPDPDRRGAVSDRVFRRPKRLANSVQIGVKSGFFIDEDVSRFDAPFFSITAKEAKNMDPMHRWMLEVAYEGFENAGVPLPTLCGSRTGCYVGCFTQDYALLSTADINDTGAYVATGTGPCMLSNRVSWMYDLRGPSLTIDTACSSSMYALHLACQSIRAGEIDQALVGGTNLLLCPDVYHSLSQMRMTSPDGKCHSFDERANGYARGEGIGALIVKSFSAAIADGDTIRAVIRGTGCNQDGRTPGITMPSAQAQADLIRSTYAKAGLSLSETAYFEAHGTGTPLGDPLELSSLGATFGAARLPRQSPLYVSSVKTNVGHLEGCSALAGIMKAVLSVEKGLIAPNAEFEKLNPKLHLEQWRLALPPETIQWPTLGVRRASVNSFGFGGSNGLVILDDAASYLGERGITGNHLTIPLPSASGEDSGFDSGASSQMDLGSLNPAAKKIFTFSAFDQAGLQRMSSSWTGFLTRRLDDVKEALPGVDLDLDTYAEDMAYTLATRRTLHDFRSFAVAGSVTELLAKMQEGLPRVRRAFKNDNIFFVFTGQGAQYHRMGLELQTHPVFARSIERSQAVLGSLQCPWNAFEELRKDAAESRIHDAEISQPLCTVLQLGLVSLLGHWGVKPKAVIGHSSGEIAAAYAAGAITHEDAIKIAYLRGFHSAGLKTKLEGSTGAMLAAAVSEEEAQRYLQSVQAGKAVIACVNSPSSVTLSGDSGAIVELEAKLRADSKFARVLKVPIAYHSHHMDPIAGDYLSSLGELEIQTPPKDAPAMFSSVTAGHVTLNELTAAYWVQNMTSPVRFAPAIKALLSHSSSVRGRHRTLISYSAMVEVGPHQTLQGPLKQTLAEVDGQLNSTIAYVSVLSRGHDAAATALECVGRLWAQGIKVDLPRVNLQEPGGRRSKALGDLPSYPWNHSKGFWHEPELAKARRFKKAPRNDLLGTAVDVQNRIHPRWRQLQSLHEQPWLEHHRITNTILMPGASLLIMALEAAHEVADKAKIVRGVELRNVKFLRGLTVPEEADQAVETSLEFQPEKVGNETVDGWYRFTIFSMDSGKDWVEHCSGLVGVVYEQATAVGGPVESVEEWKRQTEEYASIRAMCDKHIEPKAFYESLDAAGMNYGPLFQNLHDASAGPNCGHGSIRIPNTRASMPYEYEYPHLIHPATLDAIFHLLFVGFHSGEPLPDAAVPVAIESMYISADLPRGVGTDYKGYTFGHQATTRDAVGSIVVSDETWSSPKIVIQNFAARNVTSAGLAESLTAPRLCTQLRWVEDVDYLHGAAAQQVLEVEGGSRDQLCSWLQRLCHKRSDISALIIGQEGDEISLDIVRRFAPYHGRRACFDRCVVVELSDKVLEQTRKKLTHDHVLPDFRSVDLTRPIAEQGLEERSYDLILANERGGVPLPTLASLLRPKGRLISRDSSGSVAAAGLSHVMTIEPTSAGQMSTTITVAGRSRERPLPTEIVLLEPESQSPALQDLKERLTTRLTGHNVTVTMAVLADAESMQGKTIVSLIEAEQPFILNLDEQQLDRMEKICGANEYMLWISRTGTEFGPSTGLLRVVRTETPQIRLPRLELSTDLWENDDRLADVVFEVLTKTLLDEDDPIDAEYRESNGRVLIPRLVTDTSLDAELDSYAAAPKPTMSSIADGEHSRRLTITDPGSLDTLVWVDDGEASQPLGEEDVELQVNSVPLNPADIEELQGDTFAPMIGREALGVVKRVGANVVDLWPGQHVVALKGNSCRTVIRQRQDLVSAVPASAGSSGLCSVTAMLTALYAVDLVRVERDEKVLIHHAADALGQIAVQLLLQAGAEVFVTVRSSAEKDLLCQHYDIPEHHILSLGDMSFGKAIERLTDGQGVDAVFNTSTGEAFRKTLSCLADFGRLVDLSPQSGNALIDTGRQITYHKVNFGLMLEKKRRTVATTLVKVRNLVAQGSIGLVHPTTRFSVAEAAKAFALLRSGDHSGQIVLDFDPQARIPIVPPKPTSLELDSEATYVVPGGLGGLGLGIVSLMVGCGAKHIIILSRSGPKTEKQRAHMQRWRENGCKVEALSCDCTDAVQLQVVSEQARTEGWKIKGVIQVVGVLKVSSHSSSR